MGVARGFSRPLVSSGGEACPVQWAVVESRTRGGLPLASICCIGTWEVLQSATPAGHHRVVWIKPSYWWRGPPGRLTAAAADGLRPTSHTLGGRSLFFGSQLLVLCLVGTQLLRAVHKSGRLGERGLDETDAVSDVGNWWAFEGSYSA